MRKILARHNDITTALRARLANIEKEGENRPQWALKERNEAIEKAKAASRDLTVELKMQAMADQAEAKASFIKAWKNTDHRTLKHTPTERLAWQQLAQASLQGREPEQAQAVYERQVQSMTAEERLLYRHIFDQFLELAVYGDPTEEYNAARTIDKYRSAEEKQARAAMDKAERMADFVPTLKALMETNIKEAKEGEKQASDPLEVFETIEQDVKAEFAKV